MSIKPDATMTELWGSILDNFPHRDTHSTQEKQVAAYLNACHFKHLIESTAGPFGNAGEPSLRDFASVQEKIRQATVGRGVLEYVDYMRVLDELIASGSKNRPSPGMTAHDTSELDPSSSQYDTWRRAAMKFDENAKLASELDDWKKKLFTEMEAIKNLKTGCISVSDPEQGITESPLGDATLLPVISLEALSKMDAPARNWIGYNPTHQGFQLLQEAYQRGEWTGHPSQLWSSDFFRKAQKGKSSTQDRKRPQARTQQSRSVTRVEGSDTLEFSVRVDEDFIERSKQAADLAENPLGRALIEKELARGFGRLGFSINGDFSADALSISSDSSDDAMSFDEMSVDDMNADKMSIDEPAEQPEGSTRVQGPTSKGTLDSNLQALPWNEFRVSKVKAKQWLESI